MLCLTADYGSYWVVGRVHDGFNLIRFDVFSLRSDNMFQLPLFCPFPYNLGANPSPVLCRRIVGGVLKRRVTQAVGPPGYIRVPHEALHGVGDGGRAAEE